MLTFKFHTIYVRLLFYRTFFASNSSPAIPSIAMPPCPPPQKKNCLVPTIRSFPSNVLRDASITISNYGCDSHNYPNDKKKKKKKYNLSEKRSGSRSKLGGSSRRPPRMLVMYTRFTIIVYHRTTIQYAQSLLSPTKTMSNTLPGAPRLFVNSTHARSDCPRISRPPRRVKTFIVITNNNNNIITPCTILLYVIILILLLLLGTSRGALRTNAASRCTRTGGQNERFRINVIIIIVVVL